MFGLFNKWKLQEKQEHAEKKLISDDIKFSPTLWIEILLSLFLGLVIGLVLNQISLETSFKTSIAEWLSLPGLLFINLLKMIIVPLIVSSIALGIAVSHDPEFLKKLGIRVVFYYICTTAIAITIGLFLVTTINPGQYIDQSMLDQTMAAAAPTSKTFSDLTIPQRILNLIPVNFTQATLNGETLQIVIFSIFLGIILLTLPTERTKTVTDLLYFAQSACMTIVGWALKLAPLAVFGLLASITTRIGFDALTSMGIYMLTVIGGLLGVAAMYFLILALIAQRNPFDFFRNICEVQLLAFSTSTSSGVMPITMSAAEQKLGVKPEISRFVIPLGATVNMDGTALYQGVAALFLTQVFGIELTLMEMVMLLVTTIGASIGTPGTPGVGLVILATIVVSIGVPPVGIALILGVDRILDMCRTTINVTGDLTACAVMNRWLAPSLASADTSLKDNESNCAPDSDA